MRAPSPLLLLPPEILIPIFTLLPRQDRFSAILSCKTLAELVTPLQYTTIELYPAFDNDPFRKNRLTGHRSPNVIPNVGFRGQDIYFRLWAMLVHDFTQSGGTRARHARDIKIFTGLFTGDSPFNPSNDTLRQRVRLVFQYVIHEQVRRLGTNIRWLCGIDPEKFTNLSELEIQFDFWYTDYNQFEIIELPKTVSKLTLRWEYDDIGTYPDWHVKCCFRMVFRIWCRLIATAPNIEVLKLICFTARLQRPFQFNCPGRWEEGESMKFLRDDLRLEKLRDIELLVPRFATHKVYRLDGQQEDTSMSDIFGPFMERHKDQMLSFVYQGPLYNDYGVAQPSDENGVEKWTLPRFQNLRSVDIRSAFMTQSAFQNEVMHTHLEHHFWYITYVAAEALRSLKLSYMPINAKWIFWFSSVKGMFTGLERLKVRWVAYEPSANCDMGSDSWVLATPQLLRSIPATLRHLSVSITSLSVLNQPDITWIGDMKLHIPLFHSRPALSSLNFFEESTENPRKLRYRRLPRFVNGEPSPTLKKVGVWETAKIHLVYADMGGSDGHLDFRAKEEFDLPEDVEYTGPDARRWTINEDAVELVRECRYAGPVGLMGCGREYRFDEWP